MFGLNSTPFIVTVFIGPYVAQLFHTYSTFRWAFGFFAIVVPIVSIPVAAVFLYSNYKVRKMGLAPLRTVSGRTTIHIFYHYAREFDSMYRFLENAYWVLTYGSCWFAFGGGWLFPATSSPHSCREFGESVAQFVYHCDAGYRSCSSSAILRLGKVLCTSDICPISISPRSNSFRCLRSFCYPIFQLLVCPSTRCLHDRG